MGSYIDTYLEKNPDMKTMLDGTPLASSVPVSYAEHPLCVVYDAALMFVKVFFLHLQSTDSRNVDFAFNVLKTDRISVASYELITGSDLDAAEKHVLIARLNQLYQELLKNAVYTKNMASAPLNKRLEEEIMNCINDEIHD